MAENAVELRQVSKTFGQVVAVDRVSLEIRQNEFFSLLGPSGCGKTTTLRMIGGFEEPSLGDVYIEGQRANDVPPHRRKTNLIFQQLALFPHMDVFDNIGFGLRMKRVPRQTIKEKVNRVLDLVELSGLGSRRIRQLSGGQQQRVAIARALVNEPSVLLLDEPLGALDLKLRLQMQLELKELQHRIGTTFIYVTHDQGEALTMSDRLAVMRDGRVEQTGPAREVYEKPRTRFVASFIGRSNLLDGVVKELERDTAIVDCAGLLVVAARNENLNSRGQKVTLSLRPERVKIDGTLDAPLNVSDARVMSVTYIGGLIDYELELSLGIVVVAQTQAEGGDMLEVGTKVRVGWPEESCVAVAAE